MENKAALRKEGLLRRALTASSSVSAEICEKAFSLPAVAAAKTVMLYIPTKNEVDTSRLFSLLARSGKVICAPRVFSDTNMEAAIIDASGFRRGAFGVWEPLGPVAEKIDLVFVPGVLFDAAGHRLGYGKGYYDRFLKNCSVPCFGLAYSCQIVDALPVEPHDIRLDTVLTEKG